MIIVYILAFFFLILGLLIILKVNILKKKNCNYPIKRAIKNNYCILIPAREESKVIENLLVSITKQTVKINPEDVYVIVESLEDQTVLIAKKYNMSVIVRKDLEGKRRKGYALDEAIKEILLKKKYDAYFIFDADNILDVKFIEKMEESIVLGYDIGIGYRNSKNGNDSWVAAVSSLTFAMINTLGNENKEKYTNTLTISGTGYYILGHLVDKWQGFPFNSLTEDYELTLYATLNNLTTTYNTEAIFYDEQPTNYKVSIKQRTRWIKGYFEARQKYLPKIKESIYLKDKNYGSKISAYYGVRPIIYLIIGVLLLAIGIIFKSPKPIFNIFGLLVIIYLILLSATYLMLKNDKDMLNLSKKSKVVALFMNPIFLISYVWCALMALFKKNLGWEKINHTKNSIK